MKKFLMFIVLVAVCMCFVTAVGAETNFSDVYEDHWAYSSIMEFAEKGIVTGYPDGTFRPDDYVKRDEFVKIINGHVDNVYSEYSDVKPDNWAYEYILNSGIQTGETMFYPRKDINRADAIFFMYQQA